MAFPQRLTRFSETYRANSYLRLFMKLNYEYLKSPLTKEYQDFLFQRLKKMRQIKKKKIIVELKFLKSDSDKYIEGLAQDYEGLIDVVYETANMILFITQQRRYRMIKIRLIIINDIARYYKVLQEPDDEMKEVIKIYNEIVKHHGHASLSFDEKMICPLCSKLMDRTEIFKHSLVASIELAIQRGCPQ